ncbi:MAG: hypothetical protein ACFFDF_08650 [Candidatus Odinarchaeota archaeon]
MLEIGRVIEKPSDSFKCVAGAELLLFNPTKQFPDRNHERVVINPMTKEGYETLYKDSFENMGKEMISDDYKYFLAYMLDGSCEFTCTIMTNDLEDIREATEKDMKKYDRAFKEFIEEYGLKLGEEGEVKL